MAAEAIIFRRRGAYGAGGNGGALDDDDDDGNDGNDGNDDDEDAEGNEKGRGWGQEEGSHAGRRHPRTPPRFATSLGKERIGREEEEQEEQQEEEQESDLVGKILHE